MSKNCPLSFPNRFQRIHTKEEEEGEKNYRQKNPAWAFEATEHPMKADIHLSSGRRRL